MRHSGKFSRDQKRSKRLASGAAWRVQLWVWLAFLAAGFAAFLLFGLHAGVTTLGMGALASFPFYFIFNDFLDDEIRHHCHPVREGADLLPPTPPCLLPVDFTSSLALFAKLETCGGAMSALLASHPFLSPRLSPRPFLSPVC